MNYEKNKYLEEKIGEIITDNQTPYCMVKDLEGNFKMDHDRFPVIFKNDNVEKGDQNGLERRVLPVNYFTVGNLTQDIFSGSLFTNVNYKGEIVTRAMSKSELIESLGLTNQFTTHQFMYSINYLFVGTDDLHGVDSESKYSFELIGVDENGRLSREIPDCKRLMIYALKKDLVSSEHTHDKLQKPNEVNASQSIEESKELLSSNASKEDLGPDGCIDDKILQLGGATIRQGAKVFMIYTGAGGFYSGSSSLSGRGIGGGFTGGPEF